MPPGPGGRMRVSDGAYSPMQMRGLALGVGLPLLAAAILWWLAGSDIALARWISVAVILLALGGWYLTQRNEGGG